jgi:hypothetical protein
MIGHDDDGNDGTKSGNKQKDFSCIMLGNDGDTFYVHKQFLVVLPFLVFADYLCLGYFINDQPVSTALLRANFHRPFDFIRRRFKARKLIALIAVATNCVKSKIADRNPENNFFDIFSSVSSLF